MLRILNRTPGNVRLSASKFQRLLSTSPTYDGTAPLPQPHGLKLSQISPAVVQISLNSGPVNVFDRKLLVSFTETLKALEAAPSIQGVLLTSEFAPKVFSAGLDFNEMDNTTQEDFRDYWITFEKMWKAWYTTPLATVAAVNGTCPALGAVMALSADYRVMVGNSVVPTKAKFGLNESSLGMNPPAWLRGLTASVIGTRNAEWHLGNSIMSTPEEALQIGFVDALAKDSDELLQLALDRGMATLLAIPPEARALCKQGYRMPIAELADTSESADPMVKSVFGDECQGMIKAMRSKMRGK